MSVLIKHAKGKEHIFKKNTCWTYIQVFVLLDYQQAMANLHIQIKITASASDQ